VIASRGALWLAAESYPGAEEEARKQKAIEELAEIERIFAKLKDR